MRMKEEGAERGGHESEKQETETKQINQQKATNEKKEWNNCTANRPTKTDRRAGWNLLFLLSIFLFLFLFCSTYQIITFSSSDSVVFACRPYSFDLLELLLEFDLS